MGLLKLRASQSLGVCGEQRSLTKLVRPSQCVSWAAAAAAKLLQSCPTLCDPIHRRQPTRLCRPWDSPGKNTGVGCHFLLSCMKVKSESEVAQSCPTLCDPMDCSPPAPPSVGFSRQEYWSGVPQLPCSLINHLISFSPSSRVVS